MYIYITRASLLYTVERMPKGSLRQNWIWMRPGTPDRPYAKLVVRAIVDRVDASSGKWPGWAGLG